MALRYLKLLHNRLCKSGGSRITPKKSTTPINLRHIRCNSSTARLAKYSKNISNYSAMRQMNRRYQCINHAISNNSNNNNIINYHQSRHLTYFNKYNNNSNFNNNNNNSINSFANKLPNNNLTHPKYQKIVSICSNRFYTNYNNNINTSNNGIIVGNNIHSNINNAFNFNNFNNIHNIYNIHQTGLRRLASQPIMDDSSHGNVILQKEATRPPHLLSLREIYQFSQPEKFNDFAIFLWRELPTRIAHRAIELQNLPYGLSNTKSITKVRSLYTHSFHLFRLLAKPVTFEQRQAFAKEITEHFIRLKVSTELLASGIAECILQTPSQALTIQTCPFLNGFLDRFHAARIGTRLLTGQFIELHKREQREFKEKNGTNEHSTNNNNNNNNGSDSITADSNTGRKLTKIGLIDSDCRVRNVLEMAQDDAARLCYGNFGKCPEVEVEDESNVIFTYVTSDLHYILFELMKNSMRAVCEYHSDLSEDDLPPIKVVIVNSSQDREVKIKISDEGGGIPSEDMKKIFLYSFTTVNYKRTKHRRADATPNEGSNDSNVSDGSSGSDLNTVPHISQTEGGDSNENEASDELSKFSNVKQMQSKLGDGADNIVPMAGFGYGLPLSRLYARYFGGDLQVMSMDGHGTDAYLTLKYLNVAQTKDIISDGGMGKSEGF